MKILFENNLINESSFKLNCQKTKCLYSEATMQKKNLLKLTIKMMRPLPAAILRILTAWGKEGS